jgi:hypothetical protein
MGAVDTTWDVDEGTQETEFISKSVIVTVNAFNTPAGTLARNNLHEPSNRVEFELFEAMYAGDFSDYIVFRKSYGRHHEDNHFSADTEGVYGSFSTKRYERFNDENIRAIKSVWPQFHLFLKTITERLLSEKPLEAYVGVLPAKNILSGMIEHGDGSKISFPIPDLGGMTEIFSLTNK